MHMEMDKILRSFENNGFEAVFFETAAEAADYICAGIQNKTVGIGGCITAKEMGLYDAAIAEFKLLQADKARAVFALTMIGECVEAKGEMGEAVGKYKEALNLSQVTLSESLELYYLLGSVFERLGDVREALYFFENLRKRDATFRDVVRRISALKPANASQGRS
jgi:tetratricopeptide (TPR) repeat protein